MIEVIKQLFEGSGFARKKSDFGHLFNRVDCQKKDFWGVVSFDNITTFLEDQNRILNQCSEVYADPALLKNLSMIILWKTDGTIPLNSLKRSVMQIEEDAFFFKKYVLYYSSSELKGLVAELGDQPALAFLQTKLTSTDFFQEYKKEPFSQNWQSLAYRIAVKLPFLSIVPEDNSSLSSLEDKKNMKLSNHSESVELTRLETVFFKIIKNNEFVGENMDAVNFLKKLSE